MGDFRKGGGKRFGGHGGGFGRRDRGPVTMHQAICDQCGKPCEVPFRPTSGKPVYCNTCFGSKREAGNNRGGGGFGSNISKGNNDELKKQLEILNVKMDRLIKAVEAMANTKTLVAEEKVKEAVKTVPVVKAKKSVKKVSKK